MPLFFFHLRTGEHLDEDRVGVDLPDLDAARREAVAAGSDILRDWALTGGPAPGEAYEVTDQGGRLVMTVWFNAPSDRNPSGRGDDGHPDR